MKGTVEFAWIKSLGHLAALAVLCLALPAWAAQPTTKTLPDGTKITTNPDGSTTSEYPDSTKYTQNQDGSRTVDQTTKGPDGSDLHTRTTYKPDGTRVIEYPDDKNKKPDEDKPVATRPPRDGDTEYRIITRGTCQVMFREREKTAQGETGEAHEAKTKSGNV